MFDHPTYIVLDLTMPVADAVSELRRCGGRAFPPLPVEITVAGSSGVGPLLREQSRDTVFEALTELATRWPPLTATFGSIERFPNSPVMYLSMMDEGPFVALHQALIGTSIRFSQTPFPFKPHCTIRSHSAGVPDADEEQRVKSLPVPAGSFVLNTLSVYELDGEKRECRQLYRTSLAAR